MPHNLDDEFVAQIAEQFGYASPYSRTVQNNAALAREYHGRKVKGFNGNLDRFWGCGPDGVYNARKLFVVYMEQEALERASRV